MWEIPFTVVCVTAPIIYTIKAGFNVITAITEKKFGDRGNSSDHMETSLQFEIAPNLSI